jgi:four helix bundle protein
MTNVFIAVSNTKQKHYAMSGENIKIRTKALAVNVGHLVLMLPYNAVNKQYISQIVRSSASVTANYRAAARAKSDADFINKLKICEEEADETQLWLELLKEFNPSFESKIMPLHKECDELLSIIVASIKTVRQRIANK